VTAHWGIPDPAAVCGSETDVERAFREAFFILDRRISLFLSLPLKTLDSLALKRELDNIGKTTAPVDHEHPPASYRDRLDKENGGLERK
jgi:hypothetical protein